MVTGEWIRPERIENSVIDKGTEITYNELLSSVRVSTKDALLDLLNNNKITDVKITNLDLSILLDSFNPKESFTVPRKLFIEGTDA
jgi:hypothetical protein